MIELDFICDVCGKPVQDGTGCLYVRNAEIVEARSRPPIESDASGKLDVIAFLTQTGPAIWRIEHDACRPAGEDGYDIAVEQVRTWRDLVRWTAHLMPKTWLSSTDWASILGGAAEERDHRIVPVRVHGDAA